MANPGIRQGSHRFLPVQLSLQARVPVVYTENPEYKIAERRFSSGIRHRHRIHETSPVVGPKRPGEGEPQPLGGGGDRPGRADHR